MSANAADNSLLIIWEYEISLSREGEFLKMYGPDGEWATLFREARGYIRSDLLFDKIDSSRAVVMDWWESRETYETFLNDFKAEYEAMNARAEMFNGSEKCLGWFVHTEAGVTQVK